jgi:hypothetical protein
MLRVRQTKTADMSPDAVAARLWDLASLYELGVSLRTARVVGPVMPAHEVADSGTTDRDARDSGTRA